MDITKKIFFAVFFLMLASSAAALDINNAMQIQGVHAKVIISASGNIEGKLHGMPVTIKIMSMRETGSQKILSIRENLEINGKTIPAAWETDAYGNRIAVFTVDETGKYGYSIEAEIETDYSKNSFEDFALAGKINGL